MYIPKPFKITQIKELHQFIEQYPFATLVSSVNEEVIISHIPVQLDREAGQYGTLSWHVANLNPHASELKGDATLIFQGPHAYISPTWYQSTPAVPTWNYTVVHVRGAPQIINKEQLAADLVTMVNRYESNPYLISEEYKLKLLEHITGFHMEITHIEGIFKLGQNRSIEDQQGMLSGLRGQTDLDSLGLAEFIEKQIFTLLK